MIRRQISGKIPWPRRPCTHRHKAWPTAGLPRLASACPAGRTEASVATVHSIRNQPIHDVWPRIFEVPSALEGKTDSHLDSLFDLELSSNR